MPIFALSVVMVALAACSGKSQPAPTVTAATTPATDKAPAKTSTANSPKPLGENQMVWKATIDGVDFSDTCALKNDSSAIDSMVVALVGTQANIACPSTPRLQHENPYVILILKSVEKLSAEFSFTQSKPGSFELSVGRGMNQQRSLRQGYKSVKELAVNGTWDLNSRHLQGTVTGVWEGAPAEGGFEANGNVEIRFNVKIPVAK